MIKETKKKGDGISSLAGNLKEESIRKKFSKEKKPQTVKPFLYCDPPEVILQSNVFI